LDHFNLSVDDGVATVEIDKQNDRLNTLDPSLVGEFAAVLDRLETDSSIQAVVLTSGKTDNFVAGADIAWFATLDADTGREAVRQGQELFARLERLHTHRGKPVVAAIHGACLGGGN